MGLFDAFQFDPQSYDAGGLLARLRDQYQANQPSPLDNAQWPAGPQGNYGQTQNIAVGNYQMPVFGQGDPATIPTNAQPTSGPSSAPPQSPEPSIGDRLNGFFNGYANNKDRGVIGGLVGAISGAATGNAPENQTVKSLMSRGLDTNTAQIVARDPTLLRSVLPQLMGTGGQTNDIKEYEYAKREDPTLTFEKFISRKKAVNGEVGLTPIWGTGPDGKPAYIQPGKNGEAKLATLPTGFNIARDPIKVDAGTHFILLDPQTRQPVGQVPKDLQGKEAAEARGKAQGEAQVALPGAVSDAEQTTKKINDLLDHKGLDSIVGSFDQFRPAWSLSAEGKDALARYNQLKGTAFLQAYGLLRGGGAITEIEGVKAENAMARMDRSQSEGEFKAALKDFRDAVQVGLQKIRTRAGQGGQPDAASAAPAQNNLKQKYGLD